MAPSAYDERFDTGFGAARYRWGGEVSFHTVSRVGVDASVGDSGGSLPSA